MSDVSTGDSVVVLNRDLFFGIRLNQLLKQLGYQVKLDMPQLTGPEVDELYRRGASWLSGETAGHPAV